jgi:hypothetical protein
MNGTDWHVESIKSTEHQNCSKDEARLTMNHLKPKQLLCRFEKPFMLYNSVFLKDTSV